MNKKDKKKILKYIGKIGPNLEGTIHINELFRLIKEEKKLEKERKRAQRRLNFTLIQEL